MAQQDPAKDQHEEEPQSQEKPAAKSVLILHQFPRARRTPCLSSFSFKLETFLRVHGIEYENDFKNYKGPVGKTPWITDKDGKEMGDSQLILEYLIKTRDLRMAQLTPEQEAQALAFRTMMEDHFHWAMASLIYLHGNVEDNMKMFPSFLPAGAPKFLTKLIVKQIMKRIGSQAKVQGMGLHCPDTLRQMAIADLQAVSTQLGSKKYLFGDTLAPVDMTVFAYSAIIFYGLSETNALRKAAEEKCHNLKEYVDRIKAAYWPDWDDLLYKDPQPAPATPAAPDTPSKSKKANKEAGKKSAEAAEATKSEAAVKT